MSIGRKRRPRDPAQLAKLIVDIATGQVEDREPTPEEQGKDPAATALGRKGGAARAKSISAKRGRPLYTSPRPPPTVRKIKLTHYQRRGRSLQNGGGC
jgi:hypothetical protein